jgi:hypothetical protein
VALLTAVLAAAALLASGIALALPDRGGVSGASGPPQHPTEFAATQVATHGRPAASRSAQLTEAVVTIARGANTVPVPSSFFGISTEYWSLIPSNFEINTPVFERVLALLHVQGDGPLMLRIGGDSADHSFWKPRWKTMPGRAFALTPEYLARLTALVKHDRVKLIVDLNLVTDTPLIAAAWAHAAETALPKGSIRWFEVGNEPDLYSRRYWVTTIARSPLQTVVLPLELSPATYVEKFAADAQVLGESAPDIPLMGPAVAHPRRGLDYIATLIEDEHSELGAVSAHLYPYSACTKNPRWPSYPTVARLLSRQAVSRFSTDIATAVAVAHANGLKFRLTEFNSVTCGGKPGVSNTFATALWAPDALFTAMRAGADGANLHVRANRAINAPFVITKSGLVARPLLYGLMLFNRTLGPQARLVRLHLTAPRSLNLSAWAVQTRGRILHVLLIDKSNRTVRVALHLPATGRATVQRLLAPSAASTTGETLAGQRLGRDSNWIGARRTRTITPGAHGYVLDVPRLSAALVAVRMGVRIGSAHHAAHHRRTVHHGANGHGTVGVIAERPGRRSSGVRNG